MSSSNMTHRKDLARLLAEAEHIPYQSARQRVEAAAKTGLLPRRLDRVGMAQALRRLRQPDTTQAASAASSDAPEHTEGIPVGVLTETGQTAYIDPWSVRAPAFYGMGQQTAIWDTTRLEAIATDDDARQALGTRLGDPFARRQSPRVMRNEDVRAAVERNVCAEERIAAWFRAMSDTEPHPVRWSWSDPTDPRKDSLSEIDVEYSDGHHEVALPVDLTERLHAPDDTAKDSGQPPEGCICTEEQRLHGWIDPLCPAPGHFEPITAQMAGFHPDAPHRAKTDGSYNCTLCGRYVSDRVHDVHGREAPEVAEEVTSQTDPGKAAADPRLLTREDLRRNLLVQTRANEILKISEFGKNGYVSAQVVYPLQARTVVRWYPPEEVATWRRPSGYMLGKYERA